MSEKHRSFVSFALAMLIILGSAAIGWKRAQRSDTELTPAVDSAPVGEPMAVVDSPQAEIDEEEDALDDDDAVVTEVVAATPDVEDEDVAALIEVMTEQQREGRLLEPKGSSAMALAARVLAADPENREARSVLVKALEELKQVGVPVLPENLLPVADQASALGQAIADRKLLDAVDQSRQRTRELLEQLVRGERQLTREGAGPRAFASATERFRAALAIDPANARALKGLGDVQRRLIERALDQSFALKFERASEALDQADAIQTDTSAVADARAQVRAFRAQTEADQLTRFKDALAKNDAKAAQQAIDVLRQFVDAEQVREMESKIVNVRLYGGLAPGERFADKLSNGNDGPRLVVIPVGRFMMGSPESEAGRDANEGPQREIVFERGFALARNEITVAEFRAFIEATQHVTDAERSGASAAYEEKTGRMIKMRRVTWRRSYTGKRARDGDPVVHVSHDDAAAYVAWLSKASGKRYRLPSEAEFEYALRAGTATRYAWGDGDPAGVVGNFAGAADQSAQGRRWTQGFANYDDGFWGPAPVRSFLANAFRLYDMDGNVSEWVEDCWHDDYRRAPDSPVAWINPGCDLRVIRGGSWGSAPAQVRSAWRASALGNAGSGRVGFRVVREL